MPTVYDWSPLFDAINGATDKWSKQNQYNSMINSMGGTPTYKADAPPMPGDSEGPTSSGTPTYSGAFAGMTPQQVQVLKSANPGVGMPLLLQQLFKDNEYDTGNNSGINPATGKLEKYVTDKRTGLPKFTGVAPAPNLKDVNGTIMDMNTVAPGTVVPKQEADPEIVRTAIRLYPNNPAAQKAYVMNNSAANVARLRSSNGGAPKPGDPINIPHPGSKY